MLAVFTAKKKQTLSQIATAVAIANRKTGTETMVAVRYVKRISVPETLMTAVPKIMQIKTVEYVLKRSQAH